MKIGLLTFHYAYNYGAVLQAYASQKLLETMGHEVEFINYQNSKIVWNYKRHHFKWSFDILKNPYRALIKFSRNKNQIIKEHKYDSFIRNRLNVSERLYNDGDRIDAKIYDAVIIGSDQVWNPELTGKLDEVYFGHMEKSNKTKVIAWSPSTLFTDYPQDDLKKIKSYLNNFNNISVRDENLKKKISKLTQKEIIITLDPTLVLDIKYWSELCHEIPEKNYVLVYAVRHFKETLSIAKKIAREYRKELVIIRSTVNPLYCRYDKNTCSPEDFLSYFKCADYIVCSSFHGTAFSIIFEKNFLNFIPSTTKDSRVRTILNSLGLADREIDENGQISKIAEKPNYKNTKENLAKLQKQSLEYLTSSLE